VSDFTKLNLLDLDDSIGDRAPGLEGRFGRSPLGARDVGVSHWRYEPNLRSPFAHRHREQEEVIVVISGSGRMVLDGELVELAPWDAVRVAPRVARAIESGPDGLELVAIGGPATEARDGEPAEVEWPD
jgi:mannose-6-phosphate isomerase-like protein (cupin superfamily)